MADNVLAHGFVAHADELGRQVTTVGVEHVFDMVKESAEYHANGLQSALSELVQQVELFQEVFEIPGGGSLQPGTPGSTPTPQVEGDSYTVALPIHIGHTSWGGDKVTMTLMTLDRANELTLAAQRKDATSMYRALFARILDHEQYTFVDSKHGNLTILPFANSDTVQYLKTDGTVATANHYLAQAADIDDDNNPIPTMVATLKAYPANADCVSVLYVADDLDDDVMDLAGFVEDYPPELAASSQVLRLADGVNVDGVRGFGDEVLGYMNDARCWVVLARRMPSGYMFLHGQGIGPCIGMREYPDASLKGLDVVTVDVDGNTQKLDYYRRCGFGVMNRIQGVCCYIGGASYTKPTGYEANKGLW